MFERVEMDYKRYKEGEGGLLKYISLFFLNSGFRASILYRLAHWCWKRNHKYAKVFFEHWLNRSCHCSIGASCQIGGGLKIAHTFGLVIGGGTIIGENCDVRQNVTLGGNFKKRDQEGHTQPIVGNNVSIGAGAVLLGPVRIGYNSIIGANAVVTKDVPENVIVGGVPAKVIKERWPESSGRSL